MNIKLISTIVLTGMVTSCFAGYQSNKTHLRNIKVTELQHHPDGSIALIKPVLK